MSNLATEIAYLTSNRFTSLVFYSLYLAVILLKAALVICIAIAMVVTKVIGKRNTSLAYEVD